MQDLEGLAEVLKLANFFVTVIYFLSISKYRGYTQNYLENHFMIHKSFLHNIMIYVIRRFYFTLFRLISFYL